MIAVWITLELGESLAQHVQPSTTWQKIQCYVEQDWSNPAAAGTVQAGPKSMFCI